MTKKKKQWNQRVFSYYFSDRTTPDLLSENKLATSFAYCPSGGGEGALSPLLRSTDLEFKTTFVV